MSNKVEGYVIRKWFTFSEDTLTNETGKEADSDDVRKIAIAAVVKNPYAGKFSENLSLLSGPSQKLGDEVGRRLVELANGFDIESYGKSCIVGTSGEYEHGNACLTTDFANPVRNAIGGAIAWVPSTRKRGGPGTTINVPLAHKDALYVRSHYDTFPLSFGDAPNPDEILVIFEAATRGRLHARLGGLKAEDVEGKDGMH
jgi:hypothetical protein